MAIVSETNQESYLMLPSHMQDGMRRYIEQGIPCGDFLRHVLCNDLMAALGAADDINRHSLLTYGQFLYNHAPIGSYGSPYEYNSWIDMKRKERESSIA